MSQLGRPEGAQLPQLPRAGDVVAGKYRIESVIGAGGMGVVLGATDVSLGRPIAIKFLSPGRATRDGAVARFLREARAAASIQSEHVVRVFEVGTLPIGAPYIVMEHLRGHDLGQVLTARGPLPVEEAVDYVLQSCEALGEAHLLGIVHRDLKPQNLFLTQRPDGSPCIKVLDFGISKAADQGSPDLTSTDMVMGTPYYMSPEQVRSLKNVDARSDIWSLGAILFELLTGTPIYEAPTASALCAMIAMDPPVPLRARRPGSPPELEASILRCLQKDPAARFRDVAALASALAPFASERGRASVTRISRVVHSRSAAPSPVAADAPSIPIRPPSAPLYGAATVDGFGVTSYAPNVTPPAAARSNGGLIAVLAVASGLVVLAILAGIGYVFVVRKGTTSIEDAPAATPPTLASASASAAPAAIESAPSFVPVPVPDVDPPPTASPQPTAKKADAKDAGAPLGQKDAGASKPSPNKNEELAAKRRVAAGRCQHLKMLLTRNDPKTNNAATQVKRLACLQATSPSPNAGSSICERSACRTACAMLQDQGCLRDLDRADRETPLEY